VYGSTSLNEMAMLLMPLLNTVLAKSSWTLFFPSGQRTQSGLLFALTHTISSGTGRSVSIADANGWISSGHVLSHSQSMVEHLLQKLRSDVHFSAVACPVLGGYVFPNPSMLAQHRAVICWEWGVLIMSFPLVTLSVSAMPPRFTDPLYPPHFLQIEHAHS